MATATATKVTEFVFEWEGRDRNGKQVRGETRAAGENQVQAALRRGGRGAVLDGRHLGRDAVLVVTTEVDHAVLALVAAAAVAGGHAAVVVTATGLVQRAQQRLLGGVARDLDEVRDGREATARSRGLVLANSHCSNVPSVLRPDRRRCRWCPHAR